MGIKRHNPEEIVSKLRQVEVLVGQGKPRIDAIRQIGVVEQTYYRLLSTMLCIACRAKGASSLAAWEQTS